MAKAKIGGVKTPAIPTRMAIVMIVLVLFFSFIPAGAVAETVSFNPSEKTVSIGSETTLDLVLDTVPKGLAGYEVNVSLANPDKAEITFVKYPAWASLNKNGSFPSDNVMISGVDLGRMVQNGSTNVTLATLAIRGDSPGTTEILIKTKEVDADGGSPITTTTGTARLTVLNTTPTSTVSVMPSSTPPLEPQNPATTTPESTAPATRTEAVQPVLMSILALFALAAFGMLIYAWYMKKR